MPTKNLEEIMYQRRKQQQEYKELEEKILGLCRLYKEMKEFGLI